MRKYFYIFLALLTLCPVISAHARYVSRMTQDGTLFFIEPKKIDALNNIKRFEYDLTLLSWTDSITVNFTFESDKMTLPENLTIKSGNKQFYPSDVKDLFIDLKGKHYEIRITSKFSCNDMKQILESPTSPIFCFSQEGVQESAAYKQRSWLKDQQKLLNIFRLYLYSKNKK